MTWKTRLSANEVPKKTRAARVWRPSPLARVTHLGRPELGARRAASSRGGVRGSGLAPGPGLRAGAAGRCVRQSGPGGPRCGGKLVPGKPRPAAEGPRAGSQVSPAGPEQGGLAGTRHSARFRIRARSVPRRPREGAPARSLSVRARGAAPRGRTRGPAAPEPRRRRRQPARPGPPRASGESGVPARRRAGLPHRVGARGALGVASPAQTPPEGWARARAGGRGGSAPSRRCLH